jgi:ABC-type phosphate transport system substrate-binding protein
MMDSLENLYPEYTCSRNAPLNCDRPTETAAEVKGAKFCLDCGFPTTLSLPAEINGQRGNYQINNYVGVRGLGRLYGGINTKDGQIVTIKEYLLPNRCFNAEESEKISDKFKQVAGASLADGRIQNFRLLQTWESIVDRSQNRCYLVIHNPPQTQTLGQYLRETRSISAERVREILNQTLQTLEFLHTQKLRLPNNQVRAGLAHGNLNLDSILIEVKNDREFYIYLCDLALWEHLFIPPSISKSSPPDLDRDLQSVGIVAANFWAGGKTALDSDEWGQTDRPLREFIQRLSGLGATFGSAQTARQALLKLPKIDGENQAESATITPVHNSRWRTWGIVGGISALLLLGIAIWYALSRQSSPTIEDPRLMAKFSDVNSIPPGEFTYTGEQDGTWTNVMRSKPNNDRTLQELLTKPKPEVAATFTYAPIASINLDSGSKPLQALIGNKPAKNFAITSLSTSMTDELDRQPIAYDGLTIFVAASKKESSLPAVLKGQISIEQLRQIYTGKLTNWQQLDGANLPIKPYAPTDDIEALQLFEQLVLKNDPADIAVFKTKVTYLSTEKTQNIIIKEFDENRSGIISFGTVSKTWNQCSGYPLAIASGEKPAIQVLFRRDGKQIDPSVNLCDKNNYLDISSFQTSRYPLGYPVFVVYPKDNTLPRAGAKFAELLKTRQGQCLLNKVGLVPLQPMPDRYLKSNVCK